MLRMSSFQHDEKWEEKLIETVRPAEHLVSNSPEPCRVEPALGGRESPANIGLERPSNDRADYGSGRMGIASTGIDCDDPFVLFVP
ncbi:hypothetical protein K3495_g8315 [Podosphaera aphanis]|nr:hypothetical protein K3495_g8315 [Podosphaera aphanis]